MNQPVDQQNPRKSTLQIYPDQNNIDQIKHKHNTDNEVINKKIFKDYKSPSSIGASEFNALQITLIETYKSRIIDFVREIRDMRVVESIAGINTFEQKQQINLDYAILHKTMIESLINMSEFIKQINYDQTEFNSQHHNNDPEYLSELICKHIQEIEVEFLELVQNSQLRYLKKVNQLLGLQSPDIPHFRIKEWSQRNTDFLNRQRRRSFHQNYSSLNSIESSFQLKKKKSWFKKLCGCFYREKERSIINKNH